MKIGRSVFLNPVFLVCLFILIINDHYLKSHYPSFLTGKLSDFSGLLVFAVFTAFLFRKVLVSRERLILHHIAIAELFLIWKIAPIEGMLDSINGLFGIQMFGRVKDVSDLMALVVLCVSYSMINGSSSRNSFALTLVYAKKLGIIFIIIISAAAIIATPRPARLEYFDHERIESPADMDGEVFLRILQEELKGNGFQVTNLTTWSPEGYAMYYQFHKNNLRDELKKVWPYKLKYFTGCIKMLIPEKIQYARIEEIFADFGKGSWDEKKWIEAKSIVENYIRKPFLAKLEEFRKDQNKAGD